MFSKRLLPSFRREWTFVSRLSVSFDEPKHLRPFRRELTISSRLSASFDETSPLPSFRRKLTTVSRLPVGIDEPLQILPLRRQLKTISRLSVCVYEPSQPLQLPPLRRELTTETRLSDKTKVPKICSINEAFPPARVDDPPQPPSFDEPPQPASFDEVIDVRTSAEFSEDHIPGALNLPVLDDCQRRVVGKLHKSDAFRGHKTGAALISTNIGDMIERRFIDKDAGYKPLLYCWRGGLRSHSLALVLANVGFDVTVLEGGHKKYRERVRKDLSLLPASFDFRVISGPTGSGKSAILRLLKSHGGAQVLDLERIAKHKGSVLGRYPDESQPKQKLFESLLWSELRNFDSSLPVWVESESRRIGNVGIPDRLFEAMKAAHRIDLEVPLEQRIKHTIADYPYFIENPENLKSCLSALSPKIVSSDLMERWEKLIDLCDWDGLVESLLVRHYDPTYANSQKKNSVGCESRTTVRVDSLDEDFVRRNMVPRLLELQK